MYCNDNAIERHDMGQGVVGQDFAEGSGMNALHWRFEKDSVWPPTGIHQHPEEQFGFVIKGCFEMTIGDDTRIVPAGDGYYVPSNVPHSFRALEHTEAIDVFSPKHALPWQIPAAAAGQAGQK